MTDKTYTNFKEWIGDRLHNVCYHITSDLFLERIFEEYQQDHGTLYKIKNFLEPLDERTRAIIGHCIHTTADKAITLLAHDLDHSVTPHLFVPEKKEDRNTFDIPVPELCKVFERGLLLKFGIEIN